MRDRLAPLRVLRMSTYNAWADMWVMYSPTSWVLGWMGRAMMQVIFFSIVGLLLDSPDAVRYMFIGMAVMVTAMEALTSIATATWERRQGTMPLLVAAPTRLWPVFAGRSVQWVASGVLTASVAMFALGPAFGVTYSPARAAAVFACLLVAGATTYLFAMVLAALVLNAMSLRNVVANVAQALITLTCGVLVPVTFWPQWVQVLVQAVPFTHALQAVRTLADTPSGAPVAGDVLSRVGLALAAGVGWLMVAAVLLERLAAAGRRNGTIEFAD